MSKLSIADLYEGAAIEAADQELQKVLDNIMDPNTDPKTQREVTLKIKFKPNKERNLSEVYISATSKLAPDLPIETAVLVDHQKGRGIGQELKPGQGAPGQAKLPMDNVTPLREAKND